MFNDISKIKTIKTLKKAIKEKDKIIRRYELLYGEVDASDDEQLTLKLLRLKNEYESLIKEIKEQKDYYKELNKERILINSEIKNMIEEIEKSEKERR